MAKISVAVLLVVVPAVLSVHYGQFGYTSLQYLRLVEPRPVVAVVHNGIFVPNEMNAPQGVRGYLTPDGQFITGIYVPPAGTRIIAVPPVSGIYAPGGVFYPGGINDTPELRPQPVAGVVQAGTFTRNDNAVRPRIFGHMANGRFYEGGIENVPVNEPRPYVSGHYAAGGVFVPDPALPKIPSPTQSDANFPVVSKRITPNFEINTNSLLFV